MDNENVDIEVTDDFSDNIRFCLKIFYEQTSASEYSSLPEGWEYWFSGNPYGKGLYSIARHKDKVIGFCALIPIEMVVGKKVMRGAKAEFLFVLPEYRKRTIAKSKSPVSVSLLSALYESSYKYGFNLIFGVATKAAAKAHLAAGKLPMEIELIHYFALFKKRQYKEFGKLKGFIYKHGTIFASSILRQRIRTYKNSEFTVLNSVDKLEIKEPVQSDFNELLYHDKRMLKFRFKEGDYLIYSINNPAKDYLIFNKPFKNGRVFLRHWSSLDIPLEAFASVLKDLYKRCKNVDAQSVNLVFSGVNNSLKINLLKLGLLRRKSLDILLFYISNPNLKLSFDIRDWYFTDSHRGFI